LFQILVNIVAQRLQRRHINDPRLIRQISFKPIPKQPIKRSQKRRQGFPRASRRSQQRMRPRLNRRPPSPLRLSRRPKRPPKPLLYSRMKHSDNIADIANIANNRERRNRAGTP
jgi:hypothetical protein